MPTKIQECVHPYRYFAHLQGETSELMEKLKSRSWCYCFALFSLQSSPGTWESLCFAYSSATHLPLCQVTLLSISCCKIYPGLCGSRYSDKPKLLKSTHLVHNSRCKSTWGVLGGWLGLQSITSMKYLRKCFTMCCGKTCLFFLNSSSQTFLVHY